MSRVLKESLIQMELFPHSHTTDEWFAKTRQESAGPETLVENISPDVRFRKAKKTTLSQ
jgi:hypothetical protein